MNTPEPEFLRRLQLLEGRVQNLVDRTRLEARERNRTTARIGGVRDVLASLVEWLSGNSTTETSAAVDVHAAHHLDEILEKLRVENPAAAEAQDDRDADEIPPRSDGERRRVADAFMAKFLEHRQTGKIPTLAADLRDLRAEVRAANEYIAGMLAGYEGATPEAIQERIALLKAKHLNDETPDPGLPDHSTGAN